MKLIKAGILFIKIYFKLILDTWKRINKAEKDFKKFSKFLKSVKKYQKEMRQETINENSR